MSPKIHQELPPVDACGSLQTVFQCRKSTRFSVGIGWALSGVLGGREWGSAWLGHSTHGADTLQEGMAPEVGGHRSISALWTQLPALCRRRAALLSNVNPFFRVGGLEKRSKLSFYLLLNKLHAWV